LSSLFFGALQLVSTTGVVWFASARRIANVGLRELLCDRSGVFGAKPSAVLRSFDGFVVAGVADAHVLSEAGLVVTGS
jgi:hypothetical protein